MYPGFLQSYRFSVGLWRGRSSMQHLLMGWCRNNGNFVDFACHPSSKSFYPLVFLSIYFLNTPQLYLFLILSSYGKAQRRDHQYDRLFDPSQPLTAEYIPLDHPTDPWDSRPSVDPYGAQDVRNHARNDSTISSSELLNNQKPMDNNQRPGDNFFNYDPSYGYTKNAKHGAADSYWGKIYLKSQ